MADEFFGGGAAGGITLPGKQRAEAEFRLQRAEGNARSVQRGDGVFQRQLISKAACYH